MLTSVLYAFVKELKNEMLPWKVCILLFES